MCSNRTIKYGMGGYVVSRSDTVKQYKNYENKWKKELKYHKKKNKILYSISKKSGSRREIKKINKIQAKTSKNGRDSISDYSSDRLDSDSSLASDSS